MAIYQILKQKQRDSFYRLQAHLLIPTSMRFEKNLKNLLGLLLVFEMLNIGKNSYFYGHMTHTVEGGSNSKKVKNRLHLFHTRVPPKRPSWDKDTDRNKVKNSGEKNLNKT